MKNDFSPAGITQVYLKSVFPKENIHIADNLDGSLGFDEKGIHVFVDPKLPILKDALCDFMICKVEPTVKAAKKFLGEQWLIAFKTETPATNDLPAEIEYDEYKGKQWLTRSAARRAARAKENPDTFLYGTIGLAAQALCDLICHMRLMEAAQYINEEEMLAGQCDLQEKLDEYGASTGCGNWFGWVRECKHQPERVVAKFNEVANPFKGQEQYSIVLDNMRKECLQEHWSNSGWKYKELLGEVESQTA